MMLDSVIESNNKGLFNDEHMPPFEIKLIEKYAQILLPVYIFMKNIQANHSKM